VLPGEEPDPDQDEQGEDRGDNGNNIHDNGSGVSGFRRSGTRRV
jgi:hypothetical protein